MILLVDDDDVVRTVLAEILKGAGHRVVETGDPVDALGLPEALGPPDVLITDIDLRSDLNGFEVASFAHHLWPSVQIILISGRSADHAGRFLDPRDRFIQKPFSNSHLLGAIERTNHRITSSQMPWWLLFDPAPHQAHQLFVELEAIIQNGRVLLRSERYGLAFPRVARRSALTKIDFMSRTRAGTAHNKV